MTEIKLSERTMLEIAEHEGLVLEAYKDSVGVLTWGFGVTNASGHRVGRYLGKPSTVERAVEVYEWLLRTKYLPGVVRAFKGRKLTEEQLTAALSFHWNTGAIERASWVDAFLAGDIAAARQRFMLWSKPREIIGRRQAERNLFFDGKWSGDGVIPHFTRVRASGTPDWGSVRLIDIRPAVRAALAKGESGKA